MAAKLTILIELQLIRRLFLILRRCIIPTLTLGASQDHDVSHEMPPMPLQAFRPSPLINPSAHWVIQ